MNHEMGAYGLWTLVIMNSAVVLIFALSFFRPRSARDWRTFSAFAAFVIAMFVEMYGFPLTIYLLAGWLQTRYPDLDPMTHNAGHLWPTLLNGQGDAHFSVPHIASYVLLGYGFFLLSNAWSVLYAAQQQHKLAVTGPYSRVRHPQYVAFAMILLGFLLQWPTFLTLLMFPVLLLMYARLSTREEIELRAQFGPSYDAYAAATPRFVPGRRRFEVPA